MYSYIPAADSRYSSTGSPVAFDLSYSALNLSQPLKKKSSLTKNGNTNTNLIFTPLESTRNLTYPFLRYQQDYPQDLVSVTSTKTSEDATGEQGGEPPDVTFAKTAHYFMSKYDYKNALFYVNLAMDINPESVVRSHMVYWGF